MINKIEEYLFKKTENKQSKIFYTQWSLTKEYIPQILSAISHTFPHYSLHDKTHSDTIINNIVRIIGVDTLEKFSAIDLWLLLSASYFHDIGMAVFAHDKKDIFKSESFVDFVSLIKKDKKSPLHKYAQLFDVNDKKICFKGDVLTSINYDSSRFLLAEFVRKDHSERSKSAIYENAAMKLPGDPIPKRIIQLLGDICDSHTKSFEDVMKLPFCEAGIDTEDCHPRYIACLLRLGDLLDMDNNRFSTILLQTLSSIPIDSIQHKNKHLSITHIRMDKQKIEATAVSDDHKVADLASKWFALLNQEMSDQMMKWNDIVPDSSYGFLPTLGDLKVELENYDTIDSKLRQKFDIDSEKSIELLQGTGIYSDPFQSIRELLQNATDATYLRIFAENKFECSGNNDTVEDRLAFKKSCKEYPIEVNILKLADKEQDECDKVKWKITIKDQGLGMSKEDLRFLINTGSSSKNADKTKMLDEMPEWMRPSGTFGIGFQSVFLITSKVELTTRKFNKETALNVELYNPLGEDEGTILIKSDNSGSVKTGTTLSFIFKSDKIPEISNRRGIFIYNNDYKSSHLSKTMISYDFTESTSLDSNIAEIIDEINSFAKGSYIEIKLIKDNIEYTELNRRNETNESGAGNSSINGYYAKKYIEISNLEDNTYWNGSTICYRNQNVNDDSLNLKFLNFTANILSGNAKDILTLDRNRLQEKYRYELHNNVRDAILNILSEEYDNISSGKLKQFASMFIEYYSSKEQKEELFIKKNINYSDWEQSILKDKSLHDIIKLYDKITITQISEYGINIKDTYTEIEIEYGGDSRYHELIIFIVFKASNEGFNTVTINYLDNNNEQLILSKTDTEDFIVDLKSWFNRRYKKRNYARGMMPCSKKYIALKLKDDYNHITAVDHTFRSFGEFNHPKMICPYIVIVDEVLKLKVSEKFYDIVFENRYDEKVTKDDIKNAYKLFINDTEKFIEEINKESKVKQK